LALHLRTRLTPAKSLIDLTPLVDVIFLLLIFFMMSSNVAPMRSLHVEHPTLNKDSGATTAQVLVVMDADHVIYMGAQKEMTDLFSLKELLLARIENVRTNLPESSPSIVLSIDRNVDYGAFLRLFSVAQECGTPIRLVYAPADADTA
jgi:biopolymer transport protein ExbD